MSPSSSSDLLWNCVLFSILFVDPIINGVYFLACRKLASPANFIQGCVDQPVWRVATSMAFLASAPLCLLALPTPALDWMLIAAGYVLALAIVASAIAPVLHYARGATICQYLDERYDGARRLRTAAAGMQLVLIVGYSSLLLAASGRIAATVLPISPLILVPLFGYLAIFAVVFGGQSAAANASCYAPAAGTAVALALIVYRGASVDAFNREATFWTLSGMDSSWQWAIVPASALNALHLMAASPILYQHYFALATRTRLRLALVLHGVLLVGIVALLIGCSSIFAKIDCESPLLRAAISTLWSHQPGAVGYIVGGIVLLGPSTAASAIVSAATIVWEDVMRPRRGATAAAIATNYSSQIRQLCSLQMCTFAIGTGVIIVAMIWLMVFDDELPRHASRIMQTLSACASPLTAVFICALFLPCTNGRGALFALVIGLAVMALISVGHMYENRETTYPKLCRQSNISSWTLAADINESLMIGIANAANGESLSTTTSNIRFVVDYLRAALRLPATLHPILGFAITIVACLIGSFATGGQDLFAIDWNLVVCTCIGTVERLTLKKQRVRRNNGGGSCDYRHHHDRPRRPFVESDSFRYASQHASPYSLPDNTNYRNPNVNHLYLTNEKSLPTQSL